MQSYFFLLKKLFFMVVALFLVFGNFTPAFAQQESLPGQDQPLPGGTETIVNQDDKCNPDTSTSKPAPWSIEGIIIDKKSKKPLNGFIVWLSINSLVNE